MNERIIHSVGLLRNLSKSWLRLWLALLLSLGGVSCSDDDAGAGTASPEYQRVAYWTNLLQVHPDLPAKIEQIADGSGTEEKKVLPGREGSVTIHSYLGAITVDASTVSAIVTDLSKPSLFKLAAYLKTIPERARELGIVSHAGRAGKPRVIVLGSEGRIDIHGAKNSEQQTIEIYHEPLVSQTTLSVHSFEGHQAIDALLESFVRANPTRGPPKTNETVIVVGKLQALNIEGASGSSTQDIAFNRFFNSFGEETASRRMYTEAAAVAGVAIAARHAASRSGEGYRSSGSSGGSRPSGGARPRGRGR